AMSKPSEGCDTARIVSSPEVHAQLECPLQGIGPVILTWRQHVRLNACLRVPPPVIRPHVDVVDRGVEACAAGDSAEQSLGHTVAQADALEARIGSVLDQVVRLAPAVAV